jgi:hypothetical protein
MSNFRDVDRRTAFLLSPSVDERLPERHLARCVVVVIDGLDLGGMIGAYRGSGSAGRHPRMLPGVLVYGYATARGAKLRRRSMTRADAVNRKQSGRRGNNSARRGKQKERQGK